MWLGQPLHWAPSHAQTRPSGKLGIKSFPYESTQQRPRLTNRQTGDGTSALSPNAPPHFFFFPCLPSPFFFFLPLLLFFIHPGTSCLLYFQDRHIIAKPSVLKPLWRHVSAVPFQAVSQMDFKAQAPGGCWDFPATPPTAALKVGRVQRGRNGKSRGQVLVNLLWKLRR